MEQRILKIDAGDNVGTATAQLEAGTAYGIIGEEGGVTARTAISFGHKIALAALAPGDAIVKYGEVLGHARGAIAQGEHVHTHNLENLI